MRMISIEITQSGYPCTWEKGGCTGKAGAATIITGPLGEALKPYQTLKKSALACGKHAVVPLNKGCFIIEAVHKRGQFVISIGIVLNVQKCKNREAKAEIHEVNRFSSDHWEHPLDEALKVAVNSAKTKALHYHCRRPYHVDLSPKKPMSETTRKNQSKREGNCVKSKTDGSKQAKKAPRPSASQIASSSAKPSVLPLLETLNERLRALGEQKVRLGVLGWRWPKRNWNKHYHDTESLLRLDQEVEALERVARERVLSA